jgi:hypothetical protein
MRNDIMMTAAINSWTRNWTIVSSDLDLAHVLLPLSSFTLENVSPAGQNPQFRVLHNYQAPALDCFANALLVPAGDQQPSFFEIAGKEELPPYTLDTVGEYVDVLESMGTYMMRNPSVQRLEGVMKIPCHAHSRGAKFPRGTQSHSPSTIDTPVHLYQFGGVVKGGLPLLVMRAPLSPHCPKNGDGTAIGVGKN